MKKFASVFLSITLVFCCGIFCSCSGQKTPTQDNYIDVNKPVIGIAWVQDRNEAFYQNWEYIIQKAGGIAVNLKQAKSYDIEYDVHDLVANSELAEEGMLCADAARRLNHSNLDRTNIDEVMRGIDGVFVPGGEDISPTFVKDFDVSKNTCTGFSATRDVSDAVLEHYCIEHDIPMFCVCRGMQMLSIINGAHMTQDIPAYCAENSIYFDGKHRDTNSDGPKEFVRHDVLVQDKDSTFYQQIVKADVWKNIPSWHHQCVHDVEGTELREVAIDNGGTFKVIEAVEMKNKTFIIGTQFHPEVVINRVYKQGLEDPCDVNICMRVFQTFVNKAEQKSMTNPVNRSS